MGFPESAPSCFGGNSMNKEATILGYLCSIEWKMVGGRIFEMISRICSGSEENKNSDSPFNFPGMNEKECIADTRHTTMVLLETAQETLKLGVSFL